MTHSTWMDLKMGRSKGIKVNSVNTIKPANTYLDKTPKTYTILPFMR
jgi:hypothetical protein